MGAFMTAHAAQVAEVRRTLVDPVRVCERLGLAKGARRQSSGLSIRCPVHAEKTPSCSVTRGPDGTVRVRCFGCGWSGDVLTLVAAARGLGARRDFREVLCAAAEVGGLHQLAAELNGGTRPVLRVVSPLPEPEPERDYPPHREVEAVWAAARPVADVEACAVALALRGLYPDASLARALVDGQLPHWARYRGASWLETGHRLVLPLFDAQGTMRSLRAWQVGRDTTGPKRLPPSGHRATELVLANERALSMLRDPSGPLRLLIGEGEPDYLSLCQAYAGYAVIGIGSGSWSDAFAARVPLGSEIAVHTHHDDAGDRYAAHINATLAKRAVLTRSKP
jgi:hypothetical protein